MLRAGARRPASVTLAGTLLLGVVFLPFVSGGPSFDARHADWLNHEHVVSNMTADFVYFGLGRDQAAMLARQTADFGTLGEITTVAAIGIDMANPAMRARRLDGSGECVTAATGP